MNLGREAQNFVPFIEGPEARVTVRGQAQWDSTWQRLAKGHPTPRVNLTDSIVLIAATPEFSSSPRQLQIEQIRRCADTRDVIAFTRLHVHETAYDYGSRALTAASLSRLEAEGATIRFVALPDVHER